MATRHYSDLNTNEKAAVSMHWMKVSREYAQNRKSVLVDTTYRVSSRKGARLNFDIASAVDVVSLHSMPVERKLNTSGESFRAGVDAYVLEESHIRMSGSSTGGFYSHATPGLFQDIALGGYQQNLFSSLNYIAGTSTRSPWGFYSVTHPWYLSAIQSFYSDPMAYIHSSPESGKQHFTELHQPNVYDARQYFDPIFADDSAYDTDKQSADRVHAKTEESRLHSANSESFKQRNVTEYLRRLYPMPEASSSVVPTEYDGRFFFERIAAPLYNYRSGPTYHFTRDHDYVLHGFYDNVYFPRVDTTMPSLNSFEWLLNSYADVAKHFERGSAYSDRIFMDSIITVQGNTDSYHSTGSNNYVYGAHHITSKGKMSLQVRGDLRFNENYPMSPTNTYVTAFDIDELSYFSDRREFIRGDRKELSITHFQMAVDDTFYLSPSIVELLGYSYGFAPLGGNTGYHGIFVAAQKMENRSARAGLADVIFGSLGALFSMITMVLRVVNTIVTTIVTPSSYKAMLTGVRTVFVKTKRILMPKHALDAQTKTVEAQAETTKSQVDAMTPSAPPAP